MNSRLVLGLAIGGVALAGLTGYFVFRQRGSALGYVERIPGGRAAGRRPRDFNRRQLRAGTRIEMEHTPNRAVAREIAMDHLTEDSRYYSKLCRMWPHETGCELL